MNKLLIISYAKNLSKQDIISFLNKNNYTLENKEIDIIYDYIKNNYKDIIMTPEKHLNIIKTKVNKNTYDIITKLYHKYKIYIN